MHGHPPALQVVPGGRVVQQLVKHRACTPLTEIHDELPWRELVVVRNLGAKVRPNPEEILQEAKKLTRGVIRGSLLPVGEDDLLPIAMLVAEEDSV